MKYRIGLILIGLCALLVGMVRAQQNVAIAVYVDNDSLTVYIPGNETVSLQQLGFEVATVRGRETYYLENYDAFISLRFNAVRAPVCFRFERIGSTDTS